MFVVEHSTTSAYIFRCLLLNSGMNYKDNEALVYVLLQTKIVRGSLTENTVVQQLTNYVPVSEARRVLEGVDLSELSAIETGPLGIAFYNGQLDNFYSFRRHLFMHGITFHRLSSRASWRINPSDIAGRLDAAKARLASMSPEEVDVEVKTFDQRYSHQESVFDTL